MAEFDLSLLPFYRIKGQEWPQLPGLVAVSPPKRSARGRETDSLVLYLTLSGNMPFSSANYKQITTEMVQRFYQTGGSLTSAIRSTAEALNQNLMDRNMRTTGKGQYLLGRLILGVLRGSQLVTAQCGPTHIFHLTGGEARQIHDAKISGRGLGVSQTTPLYFSQIDLHAGDLLLLCIDLPAGWDSALLSEKNPSPEALSRKLLALGSEDVNAVILQPQAGKGNVTILKGVRSTAGTTVFPPDQATASLQKAPVPVPSRPSAPTEEAAVPPPAPPTSQVQSGQPASRFTYILSENQAPASSSGEIPAPAAPPQVQGAAQTVRRPIPASSSGTRRPVTRQGGRFISPRTTSGDLPEIKRSGQRRGKGFFRGLARLIGGTRTGAQKVSGGVRSFLPKLLPNQEAETGGESSPMLFLALAIPIIIVIVGGMVYTSYGKGAQYQEYYAKALEQTSLARSQTNPTDVRLAWDSTLFYLDQAENYQQTDDSRKLRQEAQTAIDNLDGILRLDFHSAIVGTLSRSIQIAQLAATDTDLYVLDGSRGSVIRTFMTGQGYEVDGNFHCEPGQYGTTLVGSLIDIETLPMSNRYEARILAMDGNGNLLYCGLNDPVAVPLTPPQLGWQGIAAFTLDSDGKALYVLDPKGNAVWEYAGNQGEYTDLPNMFFSEQVPQNMSSAIDLAANDADLYLLFEDGHVTACSQLHYEGVPMRCSDPAMFVDTRPERQPGPKISDAVFAQMTFAAAPDPSLYLLEPLTRAVYRFSPRSDSLELGGQFRASMDQYNQLPSGSATAMAISPNRYLFFSVGNQVFFATDMP